MKFILFLLIVIPLGSVLTYLKRTFGQGLGEQIYVFTGLGLAVIFILSIVVYGIRIGKQADKMRNQNESQGVS